MVAASAFATAQLARLECGVEPAAINARSPSFQVSGGIPRKGSNHITGPVAAEQAMQRRLHLRW